MTKKKEKQPELFDEEKRIRVTISVKKGVWKAFQAVAERSDLSASRLAEILFKDTVKKKQQMEFK